MAGCERCRDTGSRLEPGEDSETYCDCPIGAAFGAAWMGTGHEEETVAAVEALRVFLLAASEPAREEAIRERDEARADDLRHMREWRAHHDAKAARAVAAEAALAAAREREGELRGALAACVAELETAIRRLSEEGLVPQAINYRNRERWAALASTGDAGKEQS